MRSNDRFGQALGSSVEVRAQLTAPKGASVQDPIERRETLENAWRLRVQQAAEAWRTSRDQLNRASGYYNRCLANTGIPAELLLEIRANLEKTRTEEQAAWAEYVRVLRIFTDLVVHHKMPMSEAG